jgi:hypothetical protein
MSGSGSSATAAKTASPLWRALVVSTSARTTAKLSLPSLTARSPARTDQTRTSAMRTRSRSGQMAVTVVDGLADVHVEANTSKSTPAQVSELSARRPARNSSRQRRLAISVRSSRRAWRDSRSRSQIRRAEAGWARVARREESDGSTASRARQANRGPAMAPERASRRAAAKSANS